MHLRLQKREEWEAAMMQEWGRREFAAAFSEPASPVDPQPTEAKRCRQCGGPFPCREHPVCGHPGAFGCTPGRCAVDVSPVDREVPFVASRPELGEYDGEQRPIRATHVAMNRDGTFTIGGIEGEPGVGFRGRVEGVRLTEHPEPWRWADDGPDVLRLRDAHGDSVIGIYVPKDSVPPRVRALTEAAPQLHSGVVALLDIISQAYHDNWPARGLLPDDTGPICANLRALLDRIDKAR
jgi:hypothetical protein